MTYADLYRGLGNKGSRGSKARCHILTSGTSDVVADQLSELVPSEMGIVTKSCNWMPNGLEDTEEAQLHKHTVFLGADVTHKR